LSDLLALAVSAHGGLERWNSFRTLEARMSIGGGIFAAKQNPGLQDNVGPDGLMRRHDYTVEVLGGATGANYSTDYKEFQGIKIPTTRRVYAYDGNGQKIPDPLLVSIDIETIVFS
jgi:hypothetical protein